MKLLGGKLGARVRPSSPVAMVSVHQGCSLLGGAHLDRMASPCRIGKRLASALDLSAIIEMYGVARWASKRAGWVS